MNNSEIGYLGNQIGVDTRYQDYRFELLGVIQ